MSPSSRSASSGSRARPLPPAERRRAIVEATLPLLLAEGAAVSTRHIAEAAGIAEGTVFRAFPDKETLIVAVVESAIDSAIADNSLSHIDPAVCLEHRLVAAVEVIQRRVHDIFSLLATLDSISPSARSRLTTRAPDLGALIALIEPDAAALAHTPTQVARVIHGLTFTNTHPLFRDTTPLTPTEIVAVVLDGVRRDGGSNPPETSC